MSRRLRRAKTLSALSRRLAAARAARRAVHDVGGAAALEFAILALPFLFLVYQVIDLAMVFFVYSQIDQSLAAASRLIETGQIQNSATPTATYFIAKVCSHMTFPSASNCRKNLSVDVRTETQFANPNLPNPMAGGSFNSASLTFSPGSQGQIVIVRAFYPWQLLFPGLNQALSQDQNGKAVIVSATSFINENYAT